MNQIYIHLFYILPYRSKFTNEADDPDTFTYKKDCNISDKFKLWRSALLDLFIKYSRKDGLDKFDIPESMSEWKTEILNENNELKDWLFSIVQKSNDKKDFVSLSDLVGKYREMFPHDRSLKKKDLERMIGSLFQNMGVYIKEQHKIRIDRIQKLYRNVFTGIKIL